VVGAALDVGIGLDHELDAVASGIHHARAWKHRLGRCAYRLAVESEVPDVDKGAQQRERAIEGEGSRRQEREQPVEREVCVCRSERQARAAGGR